MGEYQGFAQVYDLFMDNIPYEEWFQYIVRTLKDAGISDGLVLDLGCGTGTLTEMLAQAGFDMIGVDESADMLAVAMEKRLESQQDILYLQQDMRELDLYGTVKAVVSICDTMNYLTEPEDFLHTLQLVNNFLDPEGLFLFDLKTIPYFTQVAEMGVDAVNEAQASYIFENVYDPDSQINEGALTIYEEQENGYYTRTEEFHYQRGYTLAEVKALAKEAGMDFVAAYEDTQGTLATEQSQRFYIILKERGKKHE